MARPQCDTPLVFPWVDEVPWGVGGGGVGAHALLTDWSSLSAKCANEMKELLLLGRYTVHLNGGAHMMRLLCSKTET
jgi:hypothetical protein